MHQFILRFILAVILFAPSARANNDELWRLACAGDWEKADELVRHHGQSINWNYAPPGEKHDIAWFFKGRGPLQLSARLRMKSTSDRYLSSGEEGEVVEVIEGDGECPRGTLKVKLTRSGEIGLIAKEALELSPRYVATQFEAFRETPDKICDAIRKSELIPKALHKLFKSEVSLAQENKRESELFRDQSVVNSLCTSLLKSKATQIFKGELQKALSPSVFQQLKSVFAKPDASRPVLEFCSKAKFSPEIIAIMKALDRAMQECSFRGYTQRLKSFLCLKILNPFLIEVGLLDSAKRLQELGNSEESNALDEIVIKIIKTPQLPFEKEDLLIGRVSLNEAELVKFIRKLSDDSNSPSH